MTHNKAGMGQLQRRWAIWLGLLALPLAAMLLTGMVRMEAVLSTPTPRPPTATATASSTLTASPTATETATTTPSPTPTATPTWTLTATPTEKATRTPLAVSDVTPVHLTSRMEREATLSMHPVVGRRAPAGDRVRSAAGQMTAIPTPTATLRPTQEPPPTPLPIYTPTPVAGPTPDGAPRRVRVPILMYHYVSDPPPGADVYRRDLSVTPAQFEAQLAYLRDAGYQSISLDDLALHLSQGDPLPPRPIILTFDDGYRDALTTAFPLLRTYGFRGTFFLFTKPIDEGNPDYLSWADVRTMAQYGMEFHAHSYDHSDLRYRDYAFLVFQILAPQQAIQERTDRPVRWFCYPSGRYDDYVIEVLRSAGFWGAVVTEQGATHTPDDLFTLRRIRVRGGDDLAAFVEHLNLDW
jgi:peptidoglycan/xylan/chitin deacetylase (PgdA/CDA1 family)